MKLMFFCFYFIKLRLYVTCFNLQNWYQMFVEGRFIFWFNVLYFRKYLFTQISCSMNIIRIFNCTFLGIGLSCVEEFYKNQLSLFGIFDFKRIITLPVTHFYSKGKKELLKITTKRILKNIYLFRFYVKVNKTLLKLEVQKQFVGQNLLEVVYNYFTILIVIKMNE